MLKEFKEFISRGNVIELSVGIIMGGAFGKIVTSLVNDMLMPLIGIALGGLDLSSLVITIGDSKILYGSFLKNILDFLIIAFAIFFIIKTINKFNKKKKEEAKKEEISEEVKVLREIKALLKKQK